MTKHTSVLTSLVLAMGLNGAALAADMGTPDEAKAMSEKAAAAVDAQGKDSAFATFADPAGGFQSKDLYVFCMDLEGQMLSHAIKPDLVGKNLIDFNKYGDTLFQNMIALAKDKGEGWVDYNWPYPGTDEVKKKTSYIKMNGAGFFCGVGAYK